MELRMRTFKIEAPQFDDLLYPIVITATSFDEVELETAVRVLRKLKQASHEVDGDNTQQHKPGTRTVASRALSTETHTFTLEEDEHKLLLQRLREGVRRVPFGLLEEFKDLLDALSSAAVVKPNRPEES
jgi:hypothetical protein